MKLSTHVRRGARGRRLGLLAAVGMAVAGFAAVAAPGVASAATGVKGYQIVHGASRAITPGHSVTANVSCGTGRSVLSGGVIAHSPLTFINSSYPTSSKTWRIVATDTGIETYKEHFTPYAVCAKTASVPGIHQVSSGPLPASPTVAVSGKYCNSGEYVVGGGVLSGNPLTLLTISQPPDTQSWQVFVNSTKATSPTTFEVFAVCIPSADVSSYTIAGLGLSNYGNYGTFLGLGQPGAAATAVPPGVFNTAGSGYCGPGQLAVAGGAFNHDQTNGFISSVSPAPGGKYWLVTDTNINPALTSEFFLSSAVCVSATT